jgi:hypothetical protein
MNAQGKEKSFRLRAFGQSGEELLDEQHPIGGHAKLNERLCGQQGKMVIEHVDDDDDKFPAVMTMCPEGMDFKQGNRYYQFARTED